MRFVFLLMAVSSMVGFVPRADQKRDTPQSGQVCALKVTGMFCGACAKTVEKAAKKIDGVTAATVSQPKGIAEITYDPSKTTPDAIAKVLTKKTPFKAEVQEGAGKSDSASPISDAM